jgi:hypothetical protein
LLKIPVKGSIWQPKNYQSTIGALAREVNLFKITKTVIWERILRERERERDGGTPMKDMTNT